MNQTTDNAFDDDDESTIEEEAVVSAAGFVMLSNAMLFDKRISGNARWLHSIYLFYSRQKRSCFPGLKTIAIKTGMNHSAISKANKELIEAGYIARERRMGRSSVTRILNLDNNQELQEIAKHLYDSDNDNQQSQNQLPVNYYLDNSHLNTRRKTSSSETAEVYILKQKKRECGPCGAAPQDQPLPLMPVAANADNFNNSDNFDNSAEQPTFVAAEPQRNEKETQPLKPVLTEPTAMLVKNDTNKFQDHDDQLAIFGSAMPRAKQRRVSETDQVALAIAAVTGLDWSANAGYLRRVAKELRASATPATPDLIKDKYGPGGWWHTAKPDIASKKGERLQPYNITRTWATWPIEKPKLLDDEGFELDELGLPLVKSSMDDKTYRRAIAKRQEIWWDREHGQQQLVTGRS